MRVRDLVEALGLEVLGGSQGLDKELSGGFVCDLLSEAMGASRPGQVLITVQNKVNVVAVAFFCDLSGIIVANKAKVDREAVEKADEKQIPLMTSPQPVFELVGRFYQMLAGSSSEGEIR